jgi:hypothetical protein
MGLVERYVHCLMLLTPRVLQCVCYVQCPDALDTRVLPIRPVCARSVAHQASSETRFCSGRCHRLQSWRISQHTYFGIVQSLTKFFLWWANERCQLPKKKPKKFELWGCSQFMNKLTILTKPEIYWPRPKMVCDKWFIRTIFCPATQWKGWMCICHKCHFFTWLIFRKWKWIKY